MQGSGVDGLPVELVAALIYETESDRSYATPTIRTAKSFNVQMDGNMNGLLRRIQHESGVSYWQVGSRSRVAIYARGNGSGQVQHSYKPLKRCMTRRANYD